MNWTASLDLEKQARLGIERARDESLVRFERELAEIQEKYSALGLGNGSDLLNAIADVADRHFAGYASGSVDTLIDLLCQAHGTVPEQAEDWIRQVFETYLSTETVRFWKILGPLTKQIGASSYDAPGRMNDALSRARKDLESY